MSTLLEPTLRLDCPPRWGTKRSTDRDSLGSRVDEVAAMLGTPLMPWQRHVADVALEIDPETDELAYREVILTVPRQSGKTTLMLAVMVHRALGFGVRQNIIYTAQTRLDARKKWEDDHLPILETSSLRGLFQVRRQIGQEAIRWHNGSLHGLTAPSEKAAHGQVLDLGAIDEAFAQEDARVEQGMKPAMVTRPSAQLWVFSTAGTRKSVYLREKVEAGRLAAEAGITSGVAYFEWSAGPDVDPADEAARYSYMPALGITARPEAVAADFQTMKRDEFRRAYLNQWPSEAAEEWEAVSRAAWEALEDPRSEIRGQVAFAVSVHRDRTWASIGAAGRRADGLDHVERIDHRPGTAWVVGRLLELRDRWRPCAIVIAPSDPAVSLIPEAEAAGLEIVKAGIPDIAGACGAIWDAMGANPEVGEPARLRHLGQADLTYSVARAIKRQVGDRWLWVSDVDISPLNAVTLARWGHATRGHLTSTAQPFYASWR